MIVDAVVGQAADDRQQLPDDDRRQAERQLVDHQQRGLARNAMPSASICCWPPREVGGRLVEPLAQHREQLEHLLDRRRRRRRAVRCSPRRRGAGSRRRSAIRNTPWPPGIWLMPSAAISLGGAWVMSRPSKHDRAAVGLDDPADRLQQRRLAGAVRAEQRDDLALVDLDVDTEQHLPAAVPDVEAADQQQLARPWRRS